MTLFPSPPPLRRIRDQSEGAAVPRGSAEWRQWEDGEVDGGREEGGVGGADCKADVPEGFIVFQPPAPPLPSCTHTRAHSSSSSRPGHTPGASCFYGLMSLYRNLHVPRLYVSPPGRRWWRRGGGGGSRLSKRETSVHITASAPRTDGRNVVNVEILRTFQTEIFFLSSTREKKNLSENDFRFDAHPAQFSGLYFKGFPEFCPGRCAFTHPGRGRRPNDGAAAASCALA